MKFKLNKLMLVQFYFLRIENKNMKQMLKQSNKIKSQKNIQKLFDSKEKRKTNKQTNKW